MLTKIIDECKKHPECAFKNPPLFKDHSCKFLQGGCLVGDIPETWNVSFFQDLLFSGEDNTTKAKRLLQEMHESARSVARQKDQLKEFLKQTGISRKSLK